jgi:phosphoribosylaminoimidazole-succinocarboxamide synthase
MCSLRLSRLFLENAACQRPSVQSHSSYHISFYHLTDAAALCRKAPKILETFFSSALTATRSRRAAAWTTLMETVYETNLDGLKLVARGKVRDIYEVGDYLLLVATDRLSAFDVVFSDPIPMKGVVLTQLSRFWFEKTSDIIDNHVVTCDVSLFPQETQRHERILRHRSMLVKRATPLKVECVVRGYLDGSAWREYEKTGAVCGVQLPAHMQKKDKLPEPIFTPATKADSGHDENISFAQARSIVGGDFARLLRRISTELYVRARDYVEERNLILSDTKFEFGTIEDRLILIDECLTPDSSRFWLKDSYRSGVESVSLDKQYVRDFVEQLGWDKKPPAPRLPEEVTRNTTARYLEAYRLITGADLAP